MSKKKRNRNANGQPDISVHIDGDVSGRVNVSGGDIRMATQTTGNRYEVNNIDASIETIGHDIQVNVSEHGDVLDVLQVFDTIIRRLDALSQQTVSANPRNIQNAKAEVEKLKGEILKGNHPDESFLTQRFRNIARMGPDILDVVTAMLQNPITGVAEIVRKVARKAREEAGLTR